MFIRLIKPSVLLANFVRYYWVLESDTTDGFVTERVVPNGAVELMFHYKNPFKCLISDQIEKKQPQSFISGLSNTYSDVTTQGESGMISVSFYPFGACNFFRFPMNETEDKDISLESVIGNRANIISQQLYDAGSIAERVKIIENFLLKQYKEIRTEDFRLINKAVSLINQNRGQLQSANLSGLLAITPKSLERKFISLVGKSPKQFSKIVRFQSIIDTVSKGHCENFTQIALEYGYYDQAHFNKDFKSFSGLTPLDFFRNYPCSSDYFN